MATSDKDQAEQGKVVKFGLGQLNNPTPKWATTIHRLLSTALGLWSIIAVSGAKLPFTTAEMLQISIWAGLTVPAWHLISKNFGWEFPDTLKP